MARILLVDDDPQLSELAAAFLRSAGHEVSRAFDGAEALKALGLGEPAGPGAPGAFDLVLLDVRLPGVDGVEVGRRLRESGRGLPVIYLTGDAECPRGDGVRSLRKPFEPERLLELIREILK